MTSTEARSASRPARPAPDSPMDDVANAPSRAQGVELIGEYEQSGFVEPPSLARRADGQVIQLPDLLYQVLVRADGSRSYTDISEEVSRHVGRGLSADNVRFLVDEKLRPMGLVALADGSQPRVGKPDPFLGLKFRMGVIPERVSNLLGGAFKWLFRAPIVAGVLGALVAADVWLFLFHGVAQALRQAIYHPELFLPLFGGVVVGAAFHETGHAAGCRYGGGHPGRMGCGLYLAWPAFYTDVTDAYRLGKRDRLRTDLGGVYFNVVVILVTIGVYFATHAEAVLLLAVIEHFEIAHQLLPIVRLDGYYIVADLTGVPDLFARMGPILRSLVPGRPPEPEVEVLKPWVRRAVTAWIFFVVPLLLVELLIVLIHLPRILGTAWDAAHRISRTAGHQLSSGHTLAATASILEILVLAIPIVGILLMLVRFGRSGVRWTARHTDGRPVLRGLAVVVGIGALAALAASWIPAPDYKPIQPNERGTLVQGVASISRIPAGRAPLYSTTHGTIPAPSQSTPTPSTSTTSTSTTSTTTARSGSAVTTPGARSSSTSTTYGSTTSTSDTTSTTTSTSTTTTTLPPSTTTSTP